MKLTKRDLIKTITLQHVLSNNYSISDKKSEKILNSIITSIKSTLVSGEDVEIRNFGNFRIKKTEERVGRNPATGEKILIKSKKVVSFKSSKVLIHRLNRIIPWSVELSDKLDAAFILANEITPSNWNVFYKFDDYKYDPDALNIFIRIPKYEECEHLEEEDGRMMGGALPFVRSEKLSDRAQEFPKYSIELEKYGDMILNEIYLILIPYFDNPVECILVHELAHVSKTWKRAQQIEGFQGEEPMHGELFQEEYEKLIKIVEKKYGAGFTSEMREELGYFRDGTFPIDGERMSFRE